MNFLLLFALIVVAMLGIIWFLARPTDEDVFIQTAGTEQLTDYLRKRERASAR